MHISFGNNRRGSKRGHMPASHLAVLLLVAAAFVVIAACGGPDEQTAAPNLRGLDDTAASSAPATVPSPQASGAATAAAAPTDSTSVEANEMGRIPILMYHAIKNDIVPPDRLRQDIALLKEAGFYPTTIREMVEGTMDIPAGKSPVVLTFDDSSPTHYRILEDGSIDPDCAVAILQAAIEAGDWAPKASFFPLLYVDPPANIVFGQPKLAEKKLRDLVNWGYEVGSHTVTHQDLSAVKPERVKKELAESKAKLEEMIGGGYEIYTLNPPYGEYPDDESLLVAGEYEGVAYRYSAVLEAAGSSSPSPFSSTFDPLHIMRITAYPKDTVAKVVAYYERHPELRYISDGDPHTVTVPVDFSPELGQLRDDLSLRVVRY